MKTFKQYYLLEKFAGYVRSKYSRNDEPAEIQINPTWSELREISIKLTGIFSNEVRGILDISTDNLYVWEADAVLHFEVLDDKELKLFQKKENLLTLVFTVNANGYITSILVTKTRDWRKWPDTDHSKIIDTLLNSKQLMKLCISEIKNDPTLYIRISPLE